MPCVTSASSRVRYSAVAASCLGSTRVPSGASCGLVLRLAPALPEHVARRERHERDAGEHRPARDALGDAVVRAGLRAHALVAAADVLEDAHLRLEVVADDVAIPALRERLDEVAHVDVRAGGLLQRLRARGRRGIERDPAADRVVEVRLDPRVSVALADRVVAPEAIVRAADEARDVARRDAELAQHQRHRGGEELAVPALRLEEEVIDGLRLAAGRRVGVVLEVVLEMLLDGLRLEVGRRLTVGPLVRELRDARGHLGWQIEVARAILRRQHLDDRLAVAGDVRVVAQAVRVGALVADLALGTAREVQRLAEHGLLLHADLEGDGARRQEDDRRIDGLEVDRDPAIGGARATNDGERLAAVEDCRGCRCAACAPSDGRRSGRTRCRGGAA